MCKATKKKRSKKDKLQHTVYKYACMSFYDILRKNNLNFREMWALSMFSFFYLIDLLHTYFYNKKKGIYIFAYS